MTSADERKEWLILACEADREGWRRACRPIDSPKQQLVRQLFGYLETFVSFLPGGLGRWLKGASLLSNFGRQFGWLRP